MVCNDCSHLTMRYLDAILLVAYCITYYSQERYVGLNRGSRISRVHKSTAFISTTVYIISVFL
jgi:hypothetical protein